MTWPESFSVMNVAVFLTFRENKIEKTLKDAMVSIAGHPRSNQ